LVSGTTCAGLSGRYIFRALGEVVVKGKSQPVSIFEVVGRVPSTASRQTPKTAAR